ncbi:MAG: acyltransferase [Acidobacteria bacterium]|nr:acyltransferase [Acidobacteriota bacterium]
MNNNRIPSLDGLRAISILLVMTSHWSYAHGFASLANLGDLGVRVFFVISGFLITGLLLRELEAGGRIDLLKFYFRRTLRIFPAYYFFLLVFAGLAAAGRLLISFKQFLPALTYTSNYFFPGAWELDHAWSLAVEEQFYLIYPGILAFCGRRRTLRLLAGVLVAAPFVRLLDHQLFGEAQAIWLTKGFHANVDSLAAGCLLAFLRGRLHASAVYLRVLKSPLLFLLPIAVVFVNEQIDYRHLDLGLFHSLNNLLIALLIDWAVTNFDRNPFGRLLNTRILAFVGAMSYSIYLWQQPFLNPGPPSRFFEMPSAAVGLVFFSLFSYFVIEKYFLARRAVWEKRIFRGND